MACITRLARTFIAYHFKAFCQQATQSGAQLKMRPRLIAYASEAKRYVSIIFNKAMRT